MKQRIARLEERTEELESRVVWAESLLNLMIPDIHRFRERLSGGAYNYVCFMDADELIGIKERKEML